MRSARWLAPLSSRERQHDARHAPVLPPPFYLARARVKRDLGVHYDERMFLMGRLVVAFATAFRQPIQDAAVELATRAVDQGRMKEAILVLAAAVELLERPRVMS